MGLSKSHLDRNSKDVPFSVIKLAAEIEKKVPEAVFAYLLGSAGEKGIVNAHSDIDIAVYLTGGSRSEVFGRIQDICDRLLGDVRLDLGIVNDAEPVFCFEVIKGKLLFCRNEDVWLTFYSRTCRKYESRMFHYEKQRRYRQETKNAV